MDSSALDAYIRSRQLASATAAAPPTVPAPATYTPAPTYRNPAVSTPGFPGAGYSGAANRLNPNLRPGMPGYAGNMRPPTPPASFTDTSITSGEWTLPRQPAGQSSLGQDIAARVKSAQGGAGASSAFGRVATPGQPTPPAIPNAFDLGNSIRSRVQAGSGGSTPFPAQGQTGRARNPSMPSLPGADLGSQIRSRVSGGQQGQWGTAPQPPAMPDFRTPTQPGRGATPSQPGIGAPGLTGQSLAPDQGYTPAPTEPTTPVGDGSFGAPQGTIPIGNITGGGDWNNVNQYDAAFTSAGATYGVDPAFLKSMMIVESGGSQAAQGVGGASGAMQIKGGYDEAGNPTMWQSEADKLGIDLTTAEGQVEMAAAILGGATWNAGGSTPEEIFLSTYYPTGCLDCVGESGHTPRMYLDDIAMYTDQINGAAPSGGMAPAGVGGENVQQGLMAQGVGPVPLEGGGPAPTTDGGGFAPPSDDVVSSISGGVYAAEDIGYGFGAQAPDYAIAAGYYADYGDWDETKHPGVDIPGSYGQEFVTPVGGTVTCSGTGVGAGSWGSGCAAFGGDANGGGTGRIEVMMDNGVSVIYGHTSSSYVSEGQRVNPGEAVGAMGWPDGSGGGHVHLEARVWCDGAGTYTLVDPNVAMYSTNPQADFCGG